MSNVSFKILAIFVIKFRHPDTYHIFPLALINNKLNRTEPAESNPPLLSHFPPPNSTLPPINLRRAPLSAPAATIEKRNAVTVENLNVFVPSFFRETNSFFSPILGSRPSRELSPEIPASRRTMTPSASPASGKTFLNFSFCVCTWLSVFSAQLIHGFGPVKFVFLVVLFDLLNVFVQLAQYGIGCYLNCFNFKCSQWPYIMCTARVFQSMLDDYVDVLVKRIYLLDRV